jgi:hypothetical protein
MPVSFAALEIFDARTAVVLLIIWRTVVRNMAHSCVHELSAIPQAGSEIALQRF